jgi:oxygen-independent coproporphyrinogen-3 oxidase
MHDGRLPEGHAQNCIPVAGYARQIGEGKLATTKGERLTAGDRMRALVIEHLMCDLAFPADELNCRFGEAAAPIIEEAQALIVAGQDRLIEREGAAFRITERGRPFAPAIAACFDS